MCSNSHSNRSFLFVPCSEFSGPHRRAAASGRLQLPAGQRREQTNPMHARRDAWCCAFCDTATQGPLRKIGPSRWGTPGPGSSAASHYTGSVTNTLSRAAETGLARFGEELEGTPASASHVCSCSRALALEQTGAIVGSLEVGIVDGELRSVWVDHCHRLDGLTMEPQFLVCAKLPTQASVAHTPCLRSQVHFQGLATPIGKSCKKPPLDKMGGPDCFKMEPRAGSQFIICRGFLTGAPSPHCGHPASYY